MGAGGLSPAANAQGPAVPKIILSDEALLASLRQHPDPAILHEVRAEADKAMKTPLISIMDEKATPPSGDKHDYMSLAPYWWPNPATPNHLPYIRRDGVHNPEATAVQDHALLSHMEANVHALALGYFLTHDETYALRAAEQLQVWFLNPATRMNPRLKYAQAIRGVNEGRGTGILDAQGLSDVVDSLGLLAGLPSWTASDDAGMHTWFETYFDWLTTSANGKDEAAAKNNHGSWYDVQTVAIALYIGKTDFARDVAEAAKTRHIAVQIMPDGDQPLEDVRTRSFHYSIYNLEALMKLATEAQTVHVDLWSYNAPSGGSIRGAVDYLLSFADKQKKWEHEDLDGVSPAPLRYSLLIAAAHYNSSRYEDAARVDQNHDARTLLLEREYGETQKAGR
jgi:hypothetical protein